MRCKTICAADAKKAGGWSGNSPLIASHYFWECGDNDLPLGTAPKAKRTGNFTAHSALGTAYGFSAKKDLLAQLLALNRQVAAKTERGEPVMPPGVPPGFPNPQALITEDCIQPSGR